MKSLAGLFAILLFPYFLTAQDTSQHDPLVGPFGDYPVFANSAEILSLTDSIVEGGQIITARIIDLDSTGSPVKGNIYSPAPSGLGGGLYYDCLAEDFDGDGYDELLTAWACADGMVRFEMSSAVRQKPYYQWEFNPLKSNESYLYPNDHIRLLPANLDSTMRKEFLLCIPTDGVLFIYAYAWDSLSNTFQQITNYAESYTPPYDIALGDFNGDGMDDIIYTYFGYDGNRHYMTIGWYRFNPSLHRFEFRSSSSIPITQWASWKRLKATAGDFRNIGRDEAVVSLNVTSGNNSYHVFNYITFSEYYLSWWTPPGSPPSGWSWGYGWESDAVAADLNPDKNDGDELIVAGPGEVAVLKFNTSLAPYYLAKIPFLANGAFETFERRHFLAVDDLDGDTSSHDWTKEIVVAEHRADSTTVFRILSPNIDINNNITGLSEKALYSSNIKSRRSELRLGDFDGDAIRLGHPTLITLASVCQPVVELNVPPTHFDYLNNQVYDICKVHGTVPSEFKVTYTETQSQSSYFSSELTQGWGVSGELSGGFSAFGFKVKAYVKSSYDQGYYGSHSENTSVTAKQVTSSSGDDWMLATVTDYDLWEYPLYAMGKRFANILVQIPHLKQTVWFPRRDVKARNWVEEHEVGNLFSYPRSSYISQYTNARLLTNFTGKYISTASSGSWELDLASQTIDEDKLTSKIGVEVGVSVKKWGMEAKVSGNYSREEVSTHRSTAVKEVMIAVDVSDTDKSFGDANYLVTPYIYWGENGAMIIDYAVDPSSSGDPMLGTFWDKNYLANPDPGFILPWRLDSYKGIGGTENLKLYNKSMRVSPQYPFTGDTVHVSANVHNFSLKDMTESAAVRFYFGDPVNGNIVTGINGITDLSTGLIKSQQYATVNLDFIVPSGLNSGSTIYAVIDPENTTAEIHEDNNKGFTPLRVQGTTGIDDNDNNIPDQFVLEQNYPNPFNGYSVIKYSLPAASVITLKIFNSLGEEIKVLDSGQKPAGNYEVYWQAGHQSSGVYFYQLQTENFVKTKKMILLK